MDIIDLGFLVFLAKLMKKVALITVTYNSARLMRRLLDSIDRLNSKPSRVLVIDNASDDVSLVEDEVERYPGFELIKLSTNIGFAAANNIGIALCDDAEYVALINPDAFLAPDALEVLVNCADRWPDVAAFGCRLLAFDDPGVLDGDGDYLTIVGKPGRLGHGRSVSDFDNKSGNIFSVCAAAALYRRDALVSIGGFDEEFFCYMEDVDLGFRLRLASYRCLAVSGAVARHIGSATTGGRHSDFGLYYGHRNLVWCFIKNMPGILFWVLLPPHILVNVLTVVWFCLRGQGGTIFRAKRDAINGIPRMWRKRRAIQLARKASVMDIWSVLDKHIVRF